MSDAPDTSLTDSQPSAKQPRVRFGPIEWVSVCIIVAVLFALLMPVFQGPLREGRWWECRSKIRVIGLGLLNYHDDYGCFPPAYIADENGRPMHSWRVLILPFLDQQALYHRYRFDEPWDGPNNSKLAEHGIWQFDCPSAQSLRFATSYVAVTGPDTAWPGDRSTTRTDITDGASKTMLVVEVKNSGINWMEPRDLDLSQMAPTINSSSGKGISSAHVKRGAHVLFADGSVRFLHDSLSPSVLRAMLTRNGGETIDDAALRSSSE